MLQQRTKKERNCQKGNDENSNCLIGAPLISFVQHSLQAIKVFRSLELSMELTRLLAFSAFYLRTASK